MCCPFTGKSDSSKEALEAGHLSLWAFCERNLKGGSFTGDTEGYVEEASGDWHLSIRAPMGNI
jgi:hypothetical protein